MRHTVTILIGQDLKPLTAPLGKYILKYGEADASSYYNAMTWSCEEDGTIIKKAVKANSPDSDFVSTMQDQYNTTLEDIKTISGTNKELEIRHFFQNLHQSTVTINNPGDSNSLLISLIVPLYDIEACKEVVKIVEATSSIQARYTIMLVGLCESLGSIISAEDYNGITVEEEEKKKSAQREMLQRLTELKLEQNTFEQIVLMQNTNSEGFALNLDQDSLLRILGELSLLFVEKYNTIFTQAGVYDKKNMVTALGLSVMNLDKYYFENYLLRRAYLRILEREDVTAEEVDLNKVAILANDSLAKHKNHFSDFYEKNITPLLKKNTPQDTIIAQTAHPLKDKFKNVSDDLTAYINDPHYSLPEKQAILAMILGYDDALLKGNLFTEQQLTIDNLDEEVVNLFIEANNACVSKEPAEDPDEEDKIIYGPLGDTCADSDGYVSLPIERLQKLRNEIRQSTNYIREKNKELEEIEAMTHNAIDSEKRLTKEGFIVDGNVYHFDIVHEEVKFDETYEAHEVKEKSVDLREHFTKIKNQGQIGACTVFAVASIYEYILKKNAKEDYDLSESFVYYNVRHSKGMEQEDTGSSFHDVIRSIGDQGICIESLHPYSQSLSDEPSAEAYIDGKKRRITKALNVNIEEKDIKSAIQDGYPVAISLKIYNSFQNSSGFVCRPSEEELSTGEFGHHAMVVVGYSDDTRYFVVRNSWGENFGDNGYCYIPYSYICDPDLNRMACIVSEINYNGGADITISVGGTGKKQAVQFNMSDAIIKAFVIRNRIEEEQMHLLNMQKEDAYVRMNYETLLQTLGKQSIRNKILEKHSSVLNYKIYKLKEQRDRINESERGIALRTFDSESWKNKLRLIGSMASTFVVWVLSSLFFLDLTEWLQNKWCWIFVGVFALEAIFLSLYWWYVKNQRRKLEIELEELTNSLSERIHKLETQVDEEKMKMHVAGMVIDNLLTLRTTIDKTYQAMKAYVGNLSFWYKEEQRNIEVMEPLVKNPFIPLLSNMQLNKYFDENKNKIIQGLYLYEYFNGFDLDNEAIIKYKRNLKQSILEHIKSLLDDFTIFRHIFETKNYPYLEKEYASAKNLLPILDKKSVPFCQIRTVVGAKQQARFLFIHTDPEEEKAWKNEYPNYFQTKPISENIVSVYKIIGVRLQNLQIEEVILN